MWVKSIKSLKIECKRINLFLGEPNTGKSNILEALGILSAESWDKINEVIRFEHLGNLFYDQNLDDEIKIDSNDRIFEIFFDQGVFIGNCSEKGMLGGVSVFNFKLDYEGIRGSRGSSKKDYYTKFYKFTIKNVYPKPDSDFLLPPGGENLLAVLMTHKGIKSAAARIFEPFGYRLVLKPQDSKIEILKLQEDILISFPYSLTSETLQRIVFYLTAIESNKNSILVFEEPESHSFPYYTKYLAERIALDKNNNQYFISTHNPYFLLPIIEKANKNEIAIFITYFEDYQTKIRLLEEKEIEEVMEKGIDIFFNIDRFTEAEE